MGVVTNEINIKKLQVGVEALPTIMTSVNKNTAAISKIKEGYVIDKELQTITKTYTENITVKNAITGIMTDLVTAIGALEDNEGIIISGFDFDGYEMFPTCAHDVIYKKTDAAILDQLRASGISKITLSGSDVDMYLAAARITRTDGYYLVKGISTVQAHETTVKHLSGDSLTAPKTFKVYYHKVKAASDQ